jgi:hypothetical protein
MSDMKTCAKCNLPTVYGGDGRFCKCNFQPAVPNPFDPKNKTVMVHIAEWEAMQDHKVKLYELLLWVGMKFPNESRYETAIRYIKQAESGSNATSSAAIKEGN